MVKKAGRVVKSGKKVGLRELADPEIKGLISEFGRSQGDGVWEKERELVSIAKNFLEYLGSLKIKLVFDKQGKNIKENI